MISCTDVGRPKNDPNSAPSEPSVATFCALVTAALMASFLFTVLVLRLLCVKEISVDRKRI